MFEELGAQMRETGAGSTQVTRNGKVYAFHLGQHSVPGGERVMQVRHFLKDAGVEPEAYPA